MTKKEYMKKLAYQLRRLPKKDYDKAMDLVLCQEKVQIKYNQFSLFM